MTKDSASLRKAHDMLSALDNDFIFLAERVEERMGPVMDAIHTLEADQPMLSYLSSVYSAYVTFSRVSVKPTLTLLMVRFPLTCARKTALRQR
jgi:hypothetical protein